MMLDKLMKFVPLIAVGLILFFLFTMFIGLTNQDAEMRNLISAKQKDNQNEMDNMFKTISGVAQVAEKDRESLKEIIIGYADSRTGNSDNLIMKWANEAVPNISSENYKKLIDTVISTRSKFTTRQKELIDIKRQHDNLLDTFPGSIILSGLLGKRKIEIVIITSSRTEEAFKTGKDDNFNVFLK
jgi:hypothetical protein